jgi:hypothetical protein
MGLICQIGIPFVASPWMTARARAWLSEGAALFFIGESPCLAAVRSLFKIRIYSP